MKNLLLTLASAALLSSSALAQSNYSLLTTKRTVNTSAIPTLSVDLKQGDMLKGLRLSQRQTRVDDAKRSHKELSYQVNGDENQFVNLGPIGLKYQDFSNIGIKGYGFAQLYFPDMLARFQGNVISQIDFLAWMGKYSNGVAFIIDMNTGRAVWTGPIEKINPIDASAETIVPNSVPCDYEITGEEGPLLIGWAADATYDANDPYAKELGVIMPMYQDNTGAGQGAFLLGVTPQGIAMLGEAANWKNEDGTEVTNCAHITIQTSGKNGLKDNDASVLQVGSVRGDLVTGKGANAKVVLANNGLDPIGSFDYTFECDGVSKNGTYTFKTPVGFYNSAKVSLPAQLGQKNGVSIGKLTVTNVNKVADEFEVDNAAEFNVISMANGFKRTPVVEELTSTYCGWCPAGIAGFEEMRKACNDDIVAIAVHSPFGKNEDPLTADQGYLEMMKAYGMGNLPSAMVNRESMVHPYDGGPAAVAEIANSVCEANMTIKTKKPANALQKDIQVETTIEFAASAPAKNYGVAYVITEDGIEGIKQLNYFAQQYQELKAQGYDDETIFSGLGWNETLQGYAKNSKADAAGNYWITPTFNDVACIINDGLVQNDASTLPAVEAGKTYTHKTKLTIPSRKSPAVNKSNLKVAALLIDRTSGVVVTGRQVALGETSTPSGIGEVENAKSSAVITVADGAFNVVADHAIAQVYTVDGKLVSSATVEGEASLPTFGKGVFVVRVVEGNNVTTQKAVF